MVRNVKKSISRLHRLDNKQAELFVLRMAITAMPTHLSRSIKPTLAKPTMRIIDECILKETERIINTDTPLPPKVVQRIRLRIANSGLGLSSKEENCDAAYVSGWADSIKLIFQHFPHTKPTCMEVLFSDNMVTMPLHDALAQLPPGVKMPKTINDLFRTPSKLQKLISDNLENQRFKAFLTTQSTNERAHILSCQGPAANAFLSHLLPAMFHPVRLRARAIPKETTSITAWSEPGRSGILLMRQSEYEVSFYFTSNHGRNLNLGCTK
eukprot:Lithocolla_globosa_v1_NODE_156_length_5631_cov_370.989060.p1 type:complete len:268 gc:universal NODE_156_length_5631_cov_370.989060:408-1211(+)